MSKQKINIVATIFVVIIYYIAKTKTYEFTNLVTGSGGALRFDESKRIFMNPMPSWNMRYHNQNLSVLKDPILNKGATNSYAQGNNIIRSYDLIMNDSKFLTDTTTERDKTHVDTAKGPKISDYLNKGEIQEESGRVTKPDLYMDRDSENSMENNRSKINSVSDVRQGRGRLDKEDNGDDFTNVANVDDPKLEPYHPEEENVLDIPNRRFVGEDVKETEHLSTISEANEGVPFGNGIRNTYNIPLTKRRFSNNPYLHYPFAAPNLATLNEIIYRDNFHPLNNNYFRNGRPQDFEPQINEQASQNVSRIIPAWNQNANSYIYEPETNSNDDNLVNDIFSMSNLKITEGNKGDTERQTRRTLRLNQNLIQDGMMDGYKQRETKRNFINYPYIPIEAVRDSLIYMKGMRRNMNKYVPILNYGATFQRFPYNH